MTPAMLTTVLSVGLIALALMGPRLLRQAAPALVRVPRVAIAVLVGGIIVWLGTLLAIGPVLAWAGSGPALLSDDAAEVCQRCLAAANPFVASTSETAIPAILLLGLPALLALSLGVGIVWQMMQRDRRSREASQRLLPGAQHTLLHGHAVSVVDADHPFALTLPARHGGIVLSAGAVRSLDDDELAAVLAHEDAHLRQRHHLAAALVSSVAVFLRWVPVITAAADALPHYLEIAADNHARRHAGTPALVSALLKLGERPGLGAHNRDGAQVLHAAGPERIRQLVHPSGGLTGSGSALAMTVYLVALAVVTAAIHIPYASAAVTGCG